MSIALGMIECASFPAALEGCDVMLKSSEGMELVSIERSGAGLITVIIKGDRIHMERAIELGVRAAEKVGEVIALHIIADPHPSLLQQLSASSYAVLR